MTSSLVGSEMCIRDSPKALRASNAITTAERPLMSTPACRTLYWVSAPPGLVANCRTPATLATLSRSAR
eukprot:9191483-Prorocentrum_lima.AAC.1